MQGAGDITVIVPTRDEAANIGAFLASLPADVALIVVDKSQDGTAGLVKRLRPSNTIVVECAGSLTQARQAGAALARSRWLLFTDADVVFDEDYFARAAALVAGRRAAKLLFGPKLSHDAYRTYYGVFAAGQRFLHRVRIPAASGSNLLVAADAFAAVGGFDLQLTCNEDSELAWRIARAGFGWAFDPRLVVRATDHRRLHRGCAAKVAHTLLRCTLLYFALIPRRWRAHDWGYWSET